MPSARSSRALGASSWTWETGARRVTWASAALVATRLAAELEPTAHVHNGAAEYRIDVEAPGLGVDDFSVHLADRLLRITGPSLSTLGADRDFEFLFRLPDQVAGGDVVASFEDGKLVIRAGFEASVGVRSRSRRPGPPGDEPPRAARRRLSPLSSTSALLRSRKQRGSA